MDCNIYQPDDIGNLPDHPGVYFYYNESDVVLYVGKAKSLKSRVLQYFQNKIISKRLYMLVQQISYIKVVLTDSESDALILENRMIKKHQPKYNILLKDDKTFPYICITDHTYPRIMITRQRKNKNYQYFGPYTNSHQVRRVLDMLQNIFRLRTCSNSYFSHRSRPCLLYQIKRCSGPCVKKINELDYHHSVQSAIDLLSGKSQTVIDDFIKKMHHYSEQMLFEKAAQYRDMIKTIQSFLREGSEIKQKHMLDIVSFSVLSSGFLIQVAAYRQSLVESQRDYFFPDASGLATDLIAQFIYQFYQNQSTTQQIPQTILLDSPDFSHDQHDLSEFKQLIPSAKIKFKPSNKEERSFLQAAQTNFNCAMIRYMNQAQYFLPAFNQLASAFEDSDWSYIDCVDISHLQGKHTTAACVRFSISGPDKASFRSYNLNTGNDDYSSMREFVKKRFSQTKTQLALPNLLLIDGGRGQISSVSQALSEMKAPDLHLLAICKAPGRKSGEEKYYALSLDQGIKRMFFSSEVTKMLENIRDHAHRFAITKQRKKHMKSSLESSFISISGLGPKRIKTLMHYFGGLEPITKASIKNLQQVPGISLELATRIHTLLHKK